MNNLSSYTKLRNYDCGILFQTMRYKAKLRQQDMADMLGVGISTLQYWESGTTFPKADKLQKMLEMYLRYHLFTPGKELAEAENIWEMVRREAPRLHTFFDREWFENLVEKAGVTGKTKPHLTLVGATARHNIPEYFTRFIGRKKELTLLTDWLRQTGSPYLTPLVGAGINRLYTLTGAGGCGKTRLALEAVREILPFYPQGAWLLDLAAVSNALEIEQAIAARLGLQKQASDSLRTTITRYLYDKQILLILDNCEHLVEECASLVSLLLRECPHLIILATSREGLRVSGENIFPVPSLSLPPLPASFQTQSTRPAARESATVESLLEYEAVQLFIDRSNAANPLFKLDEENKAVVVEICRSLDGLPLAIELAAARLKVLDIFQLSDRLANRFRLLKSVNDRMVIPRHQTLRATVDWGYNLLSEPERALFRRLSVFAGGWTLEAAETICGQRGVLQEDILDLLQKLVNKSLVTIDAETEPTPFSPTSIYSATCRLRFKLAETLREYGQELLNLKNLRSEESCGLASERQEICARHLLYYTAFARKCTAGINFRQNSFNVLGQHSIAAEQSNLRAALNWLLEEESANLSPPLLISAIELVEVASGLWLNRGNFQEAYDYLSRLQTKAQEMGLESTSQYGWLANWLAHLWQNEEESSQDEIIETRG